MHARRTAHDAILGATDGAFILKVTYKGRDSVLVAEIVGQGTKRECFTQGKLECNDPFSAPKACPR
jgi:hypothetical protein